MKCPYCTSFETKVTDKRSATEAIRRRRECLKCQKRFTTYERIETSNLLIIKKDNRREQYDRNKLRNSIIVACQKRNISAEVIDQILDKIESKMASTEKREITTQKLGDCVMAALKKLDKVAYIRFASVYREFEDITSFKEELNKLLKK